MLRRLLFLFALLPVAAFADARYSNWCQVGAGTVFTSGISSSNFFQQTYPTETVSVYNSGTLVLATIYSDNGVTPKANPFTAASDGSFFFYAANGRYSATCTGAASISFTDFLLLDLGSSTGIASINSQTGPAITIQTGTSGSSVNISIPSGNVIQFNCPNATTSITGCLGSADWTTFNGKQSPLTFVTPLVNTSGSVALALPITIGQGGTGQGTQTLGFNALSPLTTKGDFLGFSTQNVRVAIGADGTIAVADSTQGVGWRWGACTFCTLSDPLSVVHGGTGLNSGTSGGVPCYTASTTAASSSLLTTGNPLLGGGAGACPGTTGPALVYNGDNLAGNGLVSVRGYAFATAQGASISTANVVASAVAGFYKVCAYLATSTAGSGNAITTIGWTDAIGAKTLASPGTLTLTSNAFVQSCVVVQVAAATAITYATAWTTSGQYNIYVDALRMQ